MAVTRTPKAGDRSAHNVVNFPALHASDLEAGTPIHHVPAGSTTGDIPTWDGSKWTSATGGGSLFWALRYGNSQDANADAIVDLVPDQVESDDDDLTDYGDLDGDDYLFVNKEGWYKVKVRIRFTSDTEGTPLSVEGQLTMNVVSYGTIGVGTQIQKHIPAGRYASSTMECSFTDYFTPPNEDYTNEITATFHNGTNQDGSVVVLEVLIEGLDISVSAGSGSVDSIFGRDGTVLAVAGDYEADEIDFTPAGNLASTNVQAALVELDTEKSASGHTHSGLVTNGDSHDHAGGDGAPITDANLSTSDIATNNVSTSKHGFAPKAPNDATKYLDGTGAYTVPAGSGGQYRQFTYEVSGGDFHFIIDEDGNPVMALEDLE